MIMYYIFQFAAKISLDVLVASVYQRISDVME